MRYASMRSMDISNGEGVGVSLFVQGCRFHCFNCFNSEAWDFNGGKEWTESIRNDFLKLIGRPYISRISFLGGEPLANENIECVNNIIQEIKKQFPNKTIWLYTGYTWEELFPTVTLDCLDIDRFVRQQIIKFVRQQIIKSCNVVIDGPYIDNLRDITLKWRGSSNQRVIDVQKTLQNGEIVLWTD